MSGRVTPVSVDPRAVPVLPDGHGFSASVAAALTSPAEPDDPPAVFAVAAKSHRVEDRGRKTARVVEAGTVLRLVAASPNKVAQQIALGHDEVAVLADGRAVGDVHPGVAAEAPETADRLRARVAAMKERIEARRA